MPHGATVNSFTAVSLDPPLVQVTLTRTRGPPATLEVPPLPSMSFPLNSWMSPCISPGVPRARSPHGPFTVTFRCC
ncbi:flavin reductase family protein [Arthrobacter sp. MDT3-24]